jgi:molybdopterin molybdotransferase
MALKSYSEAAAQMQRFLQHHLRQRVGSKALDDTHPAESVPLRQAAGRVLAEAIVADRDQPPFARATRDGFACRAQEANSHQPLRLTGQVRAGQELKEVLGSGEVWEIMTGAPVPNGADAVFMVEHAQQNEGFVRLLDGKTIRAGDNIVPRGAEAGAGELLVPAGVRLGAAQIALAAQCGYAQLAVHCRPRVAILATGDELVPVESTPASAQIRNSNSPMLAALVEAAGGEAFVMPIAMDSEASVDAAIQGVLRIAPDLLLISGGISVGKFDLVEDGLLRVGAQFHLKGIAMQPGKPVAFGQVPLPDGSLLPFFALPGNPISSALTFHLFAAPVLAALGGDAGSYPRFASARLKESWQGKPGLTRFLPAYCDFGRSASAIPQVQIIPWQGSGDLAAFARANCAVVVPADADQIAAESNVTILLT